MGERWNTVTETPMFLAKAAAIFSDDERAEVVAMVAKNPECGDLISGTGGVRKVRVGVDNRGKSGGARVIYYFLNDGAPVYLLTAFAKSEKGNISKGDRNDLAKLVAALKASLQKKGR